ncbi:hypothetical protein [Anabaena sp. CCY 9402-a]|uniref:hypothetical protein n=1 Tax=Anabaena sp. CCY 9402-a TaxID=3103867 RepID=UPI0039C728AD
MDAQQNYAVQKLFTDYGFNTKLIQLEEARKLAEKNKLIFGGLIIGALILIVILSLICLSSFSLFFAGSGIHLAIISIISGVIIIGLAHYIDLTNKQIKSFFNKHKTLLFYLRKEAVESFVKIIFPNAEQIMFDPQASSSNTLQPTLSNLFSSNFYQYTQNNTLSFTINKKTFYIADVEPIFITSSAKESVELDKFIDGRTRENIYFCKGILYHIDYLNRNITGNHSTIITPKKLPNSPTKTVGFGNDRTTVSRDYPQLILVNRLKGRPDRFIQRGFEEYSPENMEMEDEFYVFTNNETASRKSLSYRMMETIVKLISDKPQDVSQPKLIQFLLGNQREIPKFWMEFSSVNYNKSNQSQKLTVFNTNKNLIFFNQVAEKSVTLNNFQENFQKLEEILSSIINVINVI